MKDFDGEAKPLSFGAHHSATLNHFYGVDRRVFSKQKVFRLTRICSLNTTTST